MSIAAAAPEKTVDARDSNWKSSPQYTMQGVSQNGRLRDVALTSNQRNTAVAMHLSPLSFLIIGPFALAVPLLLWLVTRENGPFEDDHGREMTNLSITALLVAALILTGIGAIFTVIWYLVMIVNMVRGSVAASNGEFFRYPMTLRFIH